jgi:hypothetical protein
MSRAGLIEKIERCARLAGSSNPHEATLSAQKGLELASRYQVGPWELSSNAQLVLNAHDAATKLSVHRGKICRLALFAGGEMGRWQVTGLGPDCSAEEMIAFAEEKRLTLWGQE